MTSNLVPKCGQKWVVIHFYWNRSIHLTQNQVKALKNPARITGNNDQLPSVHYSKFSQDNFKWTFTALNWSFLWIFAVGWRISNQNYPTIMTDHYFNEKNQYRVAFECSFYNFAKFIGHPVTTKRLMRACQLSRRMKALVNVQGGHTKY